jgi:hypothetical protein
MTYPHTKFYMLSYNGLVVTTIKPKDEYRFHAAAICFTFYEKITSTNIVHCTRLGWPPMTKFIQNLMKISQLVQKLKRGNTQTAWWARNGHSRDSTL